MTTTYRGLPACTCLEAWLPEFEKELKRVGAANGLEIYQLIGLAPESAGVHRTGGVFDVQPLTTLGLKIARQMGADATWNRIAGFTTPHAHGVLRGCPHNTPARYQLDAVDAGFNGLGKDGRGGRDDGPRPLSNRTWQQGIDWARARQENVMNTAQDKRLKAVEADVARLVRMVEPLYYDLRPGVAGRYHDGPARQILRRLGRAVGFSTVRAALVDPVDVDLELDASQIAAELAENLGADVAKAIGRALTD